MRGHTCSEEALGPADEDGGGATKGTCLRMKISMREGESS